MQNKWIYLVFQDCLYSHYYDNYSWFLRNHTASKVNICLCQFLRSYSDNHSAQEITHSFLPQTQKCIIFLLPTPRVNGLDASIKAKAMQWHITITVSALWFPGQTDVQYHHSNDTDVCMSIHTDPWAYSVSEDDTLVMAWRQTVMGVICRDNEEQETHRSFFDEG